MMGLPDGEKTFEDIYNRLHTIPACDWQTDILPWHSPRYAYTSSGKNELPVTFKFSRINKGGLTVYWV